MGERKLFSSKKVSFPPRSPTHFVLRHRGYVLPAGEGFVGDLPVAGQAGFGVAPGDVVGAVTVEVADSGEFPSGSINGAEDAPAVHVSV